MDRARSPARPTQQSRPLGIYSFVGQRSVSGDALFEGGREMLWSVAF